MNHPGSQRSGLVEALEIEPQSAPAGRMMGVMMLRSGQSGHRGCPEVGRRFTAGRKQQSGGQNRTATTPALHAERLV